MIALAFVVALNVRNVQRRYLRALLVVGAATIVLAAVLGQLRWQMALAYLVFGVAALFLLKRSYWHGAVRSLGAALAILLLAVSVVLSVGLPVMALPAPDGPHIVGSTSFSLLDESRDNAYFGSPAEKRELYVQSWYPGVLDAGDAEPPLRAMWQELHRGELDLFTVFTRYLRAVKTHSYPDIELSPAEARYPVIVFSHAIVSFAEQNTLLMEHLASQGYVVLAISHPYASARVVSSQGKAIYPAMAKINEGSDQIDAVSDEMAPRIEQAGNAEARASMQLEKYERSTGLNDLVAIWVDDLRFVLDSISSKTDRHPTLQRFADRIDVDRIGLLGMSFGGAAVTEVCKIDNRCRAASNMDGGTFGRQQRQPLQVPYLALSRERSAVFRLSTASEPRRLLSHRSRRRYAPRLHGRRRRPADSQVAADAGADPSSADDRDHERRRAALLRCLLARRSKASFRRLSGADRRNERRRSSVVLGC